MPALLPKGKEFSMSHFFRIAPADQRKPYNKTLFILLFGLFRGLIPNWAKTRTPEELSHPGKRKHTG
jgi:hypothetical protein